MGKTLTLLDREELLELPISSVVDGWDVKGNQLYLFIRNGHGVIQTVLLDRTGGL